MAEAIIIGAGVAGMGAAYFLSENRIDSTIYEKSKEPDKDLFAPFNGFKFDYASHIILTHHDSLLKLLRNLTEETKANGFPNIRHIYKGYSIKHPPIENLHELPKPLVIKIVKEISELSAQNEKSACNLKDWLYASFGKTYTDSILEKFIQKTYTLPSYKIDFSEIKNEFERSSFTNILIGALTNKTFNQNGKPKNNFPREDNHSVVRKQEKTEMNIKFGYAIDTIDPVKRTVIFENGEKENYNYLISSIPLPDLIECINEVPERIKSATNKLATTSCVAVNIETKRKMVSDSHCSYYYDSNILFSQLIYPQEYALNKITETHGSVQAIIHFSKKYKPLYLQPDNFIEPVINNMKRCNILKEQDVIIYKTAKLLPYANIIHDFKRKQSLLLIHKFLKDHNIIYCGRYGLWTNMKVEQSYESGISAAKEVKFLLTVKKV